MARRSTSPAVALRIRRALSRRCFCAGRLRLAIVCAPIARRMKVHSKRIDLPSVHLPNGKDRAAGDDAVSWLRQSTEHAEHVAADRGCVVLWNVEAKALVQLADVRASGYDRFTCAGTNRYLAVFRGVVLVEDFSDDLLEQVFHRNH